MGRSQPNNGDDIGINGTLELFRQSVSCSFPPVSPISIPLLCLDVAQKTGLLAEVLQWKNEDICLENDENLRKKVQVTAGGLLVSVLRFSEECEIDLGAAAVAKIDLNGRKYPATLVKGQAHKYDHYSSQTGIKKQGQSIGESLSIFKSPPWECIRISRLQAILREFVAEREWGKYHAPRNLLLALVGEMGELCEIVKTMSGPPASWPRAAKDELAQEVADVFIYLLRFGDVCNIDFREGLVETVAAEAARQIASRKQEKGDRETHSEQKKERWWFASSTWVVSGMRWRMRRPWREGEKVSEVAVELVLSLLAAATAACVGAAILKKR